MTKRIMPIISALTLGVILSCNALAAGEKYYSNGAEITKLDALKSLITRPAEQITKCVEVTLSPKGTIVAK